MENNLTALYIMIRTFEGCYLMPYLCPAGVWTCGWGSTGPDVMPGVRWTQAYADQRMKADALRFAKGTLKLCPNLQGNQLCAVADFSYNLGLGRLKASTLRKRINSNDTEGVVTEFGKWTKGGGKVLKGLVRRCASRVKLYLSA